MRIVCWNMNHFMRSPEQRVAAWRTFTDGEAKRGVARAGALRMGSG